MTNKMALVNNHGQMELFTKDNIKMVKNMEEGYLCGEMIVITMVIFVRTIFMERVNIAGKMAEFTKANG